MSEFNSEYKKEYPIKEDIPIEEYKEAIKFLQEFKQKPLDNVSSLDLLADAADGIGAALWAVTLLHGTITPQETYIREPTLEEQKRGITKVSLLQGGDARFSQEISDRSISLRAWKGLTTWNTKDEEKFVSISSISKIHQEGDYEITIPVSALNISSGSLFDISVHAQELKEGEWVSYLPRKQVGNTQILKQYSRLMQKGVNDVLSLNLPPPTEVPEAFYN